MMMVLYHSLLAYHQDFFTYINQLKACLPWQVYDLMLLTVFMALMIYVHVVYDWDYYDNCFLFSMLFVRQMDKFYYTFW